MKSQPVFKYFIYLSILIFLFSCKKTEEKIPVTITLESATEISETGFKISWNINSVNINSLTVEISLQDAFSLIEKEVDVQNTSQTTQVIDQMKGATVYYYRLKAVFDDGTVLLSEAKKVTTYFIEEPVSFTASDGINLAGVLKYLESNTGKKPGIIFMHELIPFGNNWQSAEVVTSLIAQGYVCLILDFRGHFQSDDVPIPTEYSQIEAFINETSKDVVAAIDFMKLNDKVDGDKLALVGASLGGIMAIAANPFIEVKASVALSASQLGIYSIFPNLDLNSTFFIAGEEDANMNGTNFSIEAAAMYNNSEEPKKLKIFADNSDHGTNLLSEQGLNQEIIDWINARMGK